MSWVHYFCVRSTFNLTDRFKIVIDFQPPNLIEKMLTWVKIIHWRLDDRFIFVKRFRIWFGLFCFMKPCAEIRGEIQPRTEHRVWRHWPEWIQHHRAVRHARLRGHQHEQDLQDVLAGPVTGQIRQVGTPDHRGWARHHWLHAPHVNGEWCRLTSYKLKSSWNVLLMLIVT